MEDKLKAFAALLEQDQLRGLITNQVDCEGNRQECKTSVHVGKRWARVDVGHSGKYMVELSTGEIVGIKGYGVPHLGYRFGTLDTIHQWDWSGYRAVAIPGETITA